MQNLSFMFAMHDECQQKLRFNTQVLLTQNKIFLSNKSIFRFVFVVIWKRMFVENHFYVSCLNKISKFWFSVGNFSIVFLKSWKAVLDIFFKIYCFDTFTAETFCFDGKDYFFLSFCFKHSFIHFVSKVAKKMIVLSKPRLTSRGLNFKVRFIDNTINWNQIFVSIFYFPLSFIHQLNKWTIIASYVYRAAMNKTFCIW